MGREVVVIPIPPDVADWMATLYDLCEVPPPHPVTFTVKEYVLAVVGVPVRFSDVVVLDTLALTPAGSDPDANHFRAIPGSGADLYPQC